MNPSTANVTIGLSKPRILFLLISGLGLSHVGAAGTATCPQVGFFIVEPQASSETRPIQWRDHQTLYVQRAPITTTKDIIEIKLIEEGQDDATLQLTFVPIAAQRLHDATTDHDGVRLAFLYDNEVLINVIWRGPYGMDSTGSQISARHGLSKAHRLLQAIQGCTANAQITGRHP